MNSELMVEVEEKAPLPQAAGPVNAVVPAEVECCAPFFHRELFSGSFVEPSAPERRRLRRSALCSVVVQSLIVGFVALLPLMFLDALPETQLVTFLVAPPPPPPPPPAAAPSAPRVTRAVSQVINGQLLAPSRIPQRIKMISEEEAPPAAQFGVVGGVEGGVPGGQAGGVLGSLLGANHSSAPLIAAPKRLRISSGVSEGMVLSRVDPAYPFIARQARVQGTVQLKAIISKEGAIENLQLVEGHPLLVAAAMSAVKQWRYRPFALNGEPVEVETFVIVRFSLGASHPE